jgi:hypothetical protein
MTSHHFNLETIGRADTRCIGARDNLADTFAILAAKGKPGDACYRPSPSLAHRVQRGLSPIRHNATDIHKPNEARA